MENKTIYCESNTLEECYECNMYYSLHSWYYDNSLKKRICQLSCSCGGNRKFYENGEIVKE